MTPWPMTPQTLGAYEGAVLALAAGGRHAEAVLLLGDAELEAAGLAAGGEIYGEVIRACAKVGLGWVRGG